ncbi:MAG: hypothetical protein IPG89_00640 [Bacteroidetes bacterium]|nr:hypothetical protein [Bacteroidota bacterium]
MKLILQIFLLFILQKYSFAYSNSSYADSLVRKRWSVSLHISNSQIPTYVYKSWVNLAPSIGIERNVLNFRKGSSLSVGILGTVNTYEAITETYNSIYPYIKLRSLYSELLAGYNCRLKKNLIIGFKLSYLNRCDYKSVSVLSNSSERPTEKMGFGNPYSARLKWNSGFVLNVNLGYTFYKSDKINAELNPCVAWNSLGRTWWGGHQKNLIGKIGININFN